MAHITPSFLMNSTSTPAFTILASVALLWALWVWSKRRPVRHFPPGPKPWPIIGNLFDIPVHYAADVYLEWAAKYNSESIHPLLPILVNDCTLFAPGNILHASVFGSHVLILNKLEDAIELLENRSHKYSSRLEIPILEMYVSLYVSVVQKLTLNRRPTLQAGMGEKCPIHEVWPYMALTQKSLPAEPSPRSRLSVQSHSYG